MLALLFASLLLAPPPSIPVSEGPPPILQPAKYRSPAGHWTLEVDPSRRDGGGLGTYVMRKDGELAWRGERPWTMWDAVVTDAGFVGGYAYTEGYRDYGAKGEFHALVLTPRGDALVDAKVKRKSSNFLHTAPNPLGLGIFHVPTTDRLVIRVADDDINRSSEEWWCYQLPDGKEIFKKRPKAQLEEDEATMGLFTIAPIAGTPLVIAQWGRFEIGNGPSRQGARFGLFDADANLVWQLVRPDDWKAKDETETDRLWDAMREGAALLPTTEPRRFALWAAANGEQLDFEVTPAPGETPAWKVIEKGSQPRPVPPKPRPTEAASVQEIHLEPRGVIELESAGAVVDSPIRDVEAFAPESADVLRFVRRESESGVFTLVHVDKAGRVLAERKVTIQPGEQEVRTQWWPLTDHDWIATQSPYGEGAKSSAWSVDDRSGKVRRLEAFEFPSIDDVAGFGDGRFIVLGTERGKYTMHDLVVAFDADGVRQWQLDEDMNSDSAGALFAPEAVAITGTGQVVVLDNIRKCMQLFDGAGKFARKIDLKAALGQEPNYPSGVTADLDGGILLHDFDGQPPLWRLDAAGAVRQKFVPTLLDGRTMPDLPRRARVAPDGKVWTTEGTRLLRLNEKGVVDLEIGPPPAPDALREPSASAIDVLGRVLIQDAKTGAVHVFGEDGKRLFVGKPAAKDVGETDSIGTIGATRDGGVMVWRDNGGFLVFGPRGEPLGVREKLPDDLAISPATGFAAGTRYEGKLVLFDEQWKPIKEIERRPDRFWLRALSHPAMGRNGSIAVVETGRFMSGDDAPAALLLYASNGEGGKMIELPRGAGGHNVALGLKQAVVYSYGADCWLVDIDSGKTTHFRPTDAAENKSGWRWGFSADGLELRGLQPGLRRLHKFALP